MSAFGGPAYMSDPIQRNFSSSVTRTVTNGPVYTGYEYGAPAMPVVPGVAAPPLVNTTYQSVVGPAVVNRSMSVPTRSIYTNQMTTTPVVPGVMPGMTLVPTGPPQIVGQTMGVPMPMGPIPSVPITETNFQRSLINGGPIDRASLREDRYINTMNRNMGVFGDQAARENEALRAEVHRLRKIEAGWFPGSPDEETRVTVVNNYQNLINANLEEISNLRLTIQQIEAENQQLRDQLLLSQSHPKPDLALEELQRTNARLLAELNAARSASQISTVSVEKNYVSQIEALRNNKLQLEKELRDAQSRLSSNQENLSRTHLDERQKLSQMLDKERSETQRLRSELSQVQRDFTRSQARPLGPDPRINVQSPALSALQDQLRQITIDRDRLQSTVIQLESKISAPPPVERIYDDAGLKDREKLIEFYKSKWDEHNAEITRMKNQITSLQSELQMAKLRPASEDSTSITLALRKEKDLQTLLRQELELAKDDSAYYRSENQRLRDQIRSMASQVNKTEIVREVIVDKTGGLANTIMNNPSSSLNPFIRPGEQEIVSRMVSKNEASSSAAASVGYDARAVNGSNYPVLQNNVFQDNYPRIPDPPREGFNSFGVSERRSNSSEIAGPLLKAAF